LHWIEPIETYGSFKYIFFISKKNISYTLEQEKKMTKEHIRPDPDELLLKIKEEESKKHRKGRLKIFLGYVAGVGKTYRMLSEANLLNKSGHQVVVGLAETHGRFETEQLLEGLDILSRKEVEYNGIVLYEFDVDKTLELKPEIVLVDELAHTNVPGSRHTKRYQDVEELLKSGIDVYSTLNIQHIESINDIVHQITGVNIKETVPDKIIELADKIELVDLPIEELIDRLKDGKVYIPEKAEQAIQKFFTEKNLAALREMALRYATVHVDYDMDYYLKKENILGPWETSNKIMACISSNTSSKRLIRIAHRFSDRFNAEWFAVYVEPSYKFRGKPQEMIELEKNLELAEELEGKVFRLTGSVADEISEFAESKNITMIMMGHSRRSHIQELLEGSIINKVIQKSNAQVLVVENEEELLEDTDVLPETNTYNVDWKPYLTSFLSILATLIACLFLRPFIEATNIPMIFIVPILFTSIFYGKKAGIITSILAVASFDFFFVQPFYSFSVDDIRFIPTFLVLLIVGIITSLLADTVKKQVTVTRQREKFISALYEFSRDLLSSKDLEDIIERSTRYISETFNYDVIILLPEKNRNLKVVSRFGMDKQFNDNELGVSNWVFQQNKAAGRGTNTLSSSEWYQIPLNVHEGILGVLAIATEENADSEQKHLVESFARVVALALSNQLNKNKN
jgi:two-component system sensor histidine kinase KdpD